VLIAYILTKDLAGIVDEQQADIDDIEAQVALGHGRVNAGLQQITRASGHQQTTGKLLRYSLIFLVLGSIVTTLVLVLKAA
jgi:t-SNARE complex subunit (syntaxin)